MTLSSSRTDRFGHFEIVDVIAKTTSRDSLGGIFETSTANIYIIVQQYLSMNKFNRTFGILVLLYIHWRAQNIINKFIIQQKSL